MEFAEVLARRRMVRNYRDDPVDRDTLTRIAEAALRAPSAGFSQGQAVVVVTDPEIRSKIAAAANEEEYVARGFDPWISKAPAHIVLCVSEEAYHRRYRMPDKLDADGNEIEWPIPYWWVDIGASLMAVLLAAVDEGLAAGFLGTHAISDLRSLLGVPDEFTPIGVVTVGHPAPDRRSSSLDLGRRPRHTVLHWQRWGG
ncbi:MAG TPA: nitroreductase family protein [Acidimicrobiia bacterium]|jgi:nitroreductase